MRMPGTLLLPGGFIVISIAAYFAHMSDATAPLATPLVVALAIAGYALSPPWKRFELDRWAAGAAAGVYWVFAAPVVLVWSHVRRLHQARRHRDVHVVPRSGPDNTATAPPASFHRRTRPLCSHEGYKYGYPLGSMLPIDVGHTLLRVDQLWLWQPYLTFLAVLTGLGLYEARLGSRAIARAAGLRRVLRRAGGAHLRLRALGRSEGALHAERRALRGVPRSPGEDRHPAAGDPARRGLGRPDRRAERRRRRLACPDDRRRCGAARPLPVRTRTL